MEDKNAVRAARTGAVKKVALYRFSAAVMGRKAGRSAVAASAYRAGSEIQDQRTGRVHDYSRRKGVEHSEILTPDGTPDWMRDRAALWNGVEAAERRKDAQLAREVQLALPRELTPEARLSLVRSFVKEEFVGRGMIADLAIHNPAASDGREQPHAHVMLTMRELTGEGFGKKERAWNADALLLEWRERWAGAVNHALGAAQSEARVDHRSLAVQQASVETAGLSGAAGDDRSSMAQPRLGAAWHMEARARDHAANDNRPYEPVTERGVLYQVLKEREEQARALVHALKERVASLWQRAQTAFDALVRVAGAEQPSGLQDRPERAMSQPQRSEGLREGDHALAGDGGQRGDDMGNTQGRELSRQERFECAKQVADGQSGGQGDQRAGQERFEQARQIAEQIKDQKHEQSHGQQRSRQDYGQE